MLEPVSGSTTSPKSVFQAAMEPFHQTIGLRVIGGGGSVVNVEMLTKTEPQCRSELSAVISGDVIWNTMTGHPGTHQSIGTSISSDGGQRDGIQPAGGVVNNGEEVGIAIGGR